MDQNQHEHDEGDVRLAAGDLLVGAEPIRAFLVELGIPQGVDVYYLKRAGTWPIGNTGGGGGGRLIASKGQLLGYIHKLTRGPAAA